MLLWLTIILNTLGTAAPGAVQRCCSSCSVLKPLTGSAFCWVLLPHPLCRCWSHLSFAFQAKPHNSPVLVPKFKESKSRTKQSKQKVFAVFVAWGDKGSEGGLREEGFWLPRTEQKSFFFFFFLHPFRRSAISCVVPAVSMLHLLLLNRFLFTASKNFLLKSLICRTRSVFTVSFGQDSVVLFLSPWYTDLSDWGVVCACLRACMRACSQ